MDQALQLRVVPPTKIVKLGSPAFYYSSLQRATLQAVHMASERFPDTVRRH